jgi:hypothetical protein
MIRLLQRDMIVGKVQNVKNFPEMDAWFVPTKRG